MASERPSRQLFHKTSESGEVSFLTAPVLNWDGTPLNVRVMLLDVCEACSLFAEAIRFRQPYQYFDLLDQIRQLIAASRFRITSGNCEISGIKPGAPWPCDVIEHRFACTCCGQQFRLFTETYHGSGGSWSAV